MARPLKIAKSSTIDIGFPNDETSDNGFTGNGIGVVGGNGVSLNVLVRAKIGTDAESDGYILRQKGKRKFLVASTTAIQDEDIVAGGTYVITSVSNTDWEALGAGTDARVGKIFTATISGTGLTTDGVVSAVGICVLADSVDDELADDTMTVTVTDDEASTFRLSTITNHWGLDFAGTKYVLSFFSTAAAGTIPGTDYAEVAVRNND